MAIALPEPPVRRPFHHLALWHRSAPRRLRERWLAGDERDRWKAWSKHLSRRRAPRPLEFLAGRRPPILWAWPDSWGRTDVAVTTRALAARPAELLHGDHEPLEALRAVATAYALPKLADEMPADDWWNLAEALHQLAADAQQIRVELSGSVAEIVRQQLLAGELPLALSYLHPELRPLRALRKPARQALSEALVALTDGKGQPHARLLPVLGPLLASWTRARWLGERLKRGPWSYAAETQFRWLVRQVIRLADGDKRFLLTGGEDCDEHVVVPDLRPLMAAAIELAGDEGDCAAAAAVIGKSVLPKGVKVGRRDLPKPALNSEWAGAAVLSTGWSQSDTRLAVAYADDPLALELHVGGRRLLAGRWHTNTVCDGRPVCAVGNWEELYWSSDAECDFLELGIELAEGLHVERQILFAKRDGVLLLADSLLTEDRVARRLRHSYSLPLAPDVAWQPEDETRDGRLVAGQRPVAVMPLALSEWRSDPRGGTLVNDAGALTLTQETTGRALYCPLLVDLEPRRVKKERTWRQLTVAEMLEVVPRDGAVAFRAQSGRDQWFLYRSLGPLGNRTALGQNISSEFCAGRFQTSGKLDEWIDIELDE